MLRLTIIWQLYFLAWYGSQFTFAQGSTSYFQDFEEEFQLEGFPNSFLPNWMGNELRNNSSRIFQGIGMGRNSSKALAIQPISTFDGVIYITLHQANYLNPKVRFWAKSMKNGSGNRPVLIYYSWSEQVDSGYQPPTLLGSENEFKNENQEFRQYELSPPDILAANDTVFLRLEIKYGPGSGTCARWVMDDFEFTDALEDRSPPEVFEVKGYDENSIQIAFSEKIDVVFSEFNFNYTLDDLQPLHARLSEDSIVHLSFDRKLENSQTYQLRVTQIPDLAGNFLQDTLITFHFQDPTHIPPKALVINEIMPAPKADLDLPNVEYIEIFNTEEFALRLADCTLSNSRATTFLPDIWIDSGEYLILAPEKQYQLLEEYGRVIPLKNWPTLLNSGDQLSLKNKDELIIDYLSYSTASWKGSTNASNGFSLEVVNPFSTCEQSELLEPSIAPSRGTPGKQNSVFDISPDQEQPNIENIQFENAKTLLLQFTKPIKPKISLHNFHFTPPLFIDTVLQMSTKQVKVIFSQGVQVSLPIQLKIEAIYDCSGNPLVLEKPIDLILPKQAEIGEVHINELLFNPKTGSPKFVELINSTDLHLEIGNWKLANLDTEGHTNQAKLLSENSLILPPKGIIAFTTDPHQLKLDYPKSEFATIIQLKSLPSYPIAGGTVILMDSEENIAEEFPYSENLHHPLLQHTKGVSLERLSLQSPAQLSYNWHSASANEGFATPGRANSNLFMDALWDQLLTITPEVFDPAGRDGNTFTSISYQLDQVGWTGTFKIYSISGRLIQTLTQNEFLGAKGLFTWSGVDTQGRLVRPGYYILSVELYNLAGEVVNLKKTIVVATQL